MPTDKNIQDLANENQRLLAENTQFKDFVIRVASMKTYGEWIDEFGTTSNLKETAILLLGGHQAPEAIAPKPKFERADIVRIMHGGNKGKLGQITQATGFGSDYMVQVMETGQHERYHELELEAYQAPKPDLSFTAHDDATSHGCRMCGNEYKSLNEDGYCSSCWTVWKS